MAGADADDGVGDGAVRREGKSENVTDMSSFGGKGHCPGIGAVAFLMARKSKICSVKAKITGNGAKFAEIWGGEV